MPVSADPLARGGLQALLAQEGLDAVVDGDQAVDADVALWDLGPVTVVRGAASVVVGISTSGALLRTYAAVADRAVSSVSSMWAR